MTVLRNIIALLTAAALIGTPAAVHAQPSETEPQARQSVPPQAIMARLRIGRKRRTVYLLGRHEGNVVYCYPETTRMRAVLPLAEIEDVDLRLEIDDNAVGQALRAGEWSRAGAILFKAVYPALPFFDLPGNDGVEVALKAAKFLMQGGHAKCRCGLDLDGRGAARTEYRAAHKLLESIGMASRWFDEAEEAQLLDIICQVLLDEVDNARNALEGIAEPESDAEVYGLYKLAQAYIHLAQGEPRASLEAAVRSVAFDDKNLETFPVALLLSAEGYEKIGRWYRARDVYYELARLFENTYWDALARTRLAYIMDHGLTSERETAKVSNVFFGIEEDVNAKVMALLGRTEPDNPDNEENEE